MTLASVDSVYKTYKKAAAAALSGVSLRVGPGEIIAVIGHNGAGKSTLFDIIGGLMKPDAGTVSIGVEPTEVGWCPQREIIDWSLTVRQNVALGLDLRNRKKHAQRKAMVEKVCAAMGLTKFLDVTAETLSGGELRRTQIARAMVGEPTLMILDEPTTGLDPSGIETVFTYLDARRSDGASALISTHETSRFSSHCTRVIALRAGQLIADEPVTDFMNRAPGSDDLWSAYLTLPDVADNAQEGQVHEAADPS
jgi:ABC-type multidrug transport system ATPase subunit